MSKCRESTLTIAGPSTSMPKIVLSGLRYLSLSHRIQCISWTQGFQQVYWAERTGIHAGGVLSSKKYGFNSAHSYKVDVNRYYQSECGPRLRCCATSNTDGNIIALLRFPYHPFLIALMTVWPNQPLIRHPTEAGAPSSDTQRSGHGTFVFCKAANNVRYDGLLCGVGFDRPRLE